MNFDKINWSLWVFGVGTEYDWTLHDVFDKLKDAEEAARNIPSYVEWRIMRVEHKTHIHHIPKKPIYI